MTSEGKTKEIEFEIPCKGIDSLGKEFLEEPVIATVTVFQSAETMISSLVDCPYNTGGHGDRCKASHPEIDKIGKEGIGCPYSFDIPHAFDRRKE